MIFIVYLSTLTFRCRFPISTLIPYNIKFVQRGAFEDRIPSVGRGFTVSYVSKCCTEPRIWLSLGSLRVSQVIGNVLTN
jgi:hypothetical protein